MALQANKTLENGLVVSYWRINEVKLMAPDQWPSASGWKPHLHVNLQGYHDEACRQAAKMATHYTFDFDVLPTGGTHGDGWKTILTAGTSTSGDIRPAIYDAFKTNSGIFMQHDGFISGAADV